jgi:hypothetical protein
MSRNHIVNVTAVAASAIVAYNTDARQEMSLAQRFGSHLTVGGGDDSPDQFGARAPLAADESVNGRVRNAVLGRKATEGKVVSLAEVRQRVHSGMLPNRQEECKPYPAIPAVVTFLPGGQNTTMGKGRTKQLPIADDNRVYELRMARGWTQEELADRIGVAG